MRIFLFYFTLLSMSLLAAAQEQSSLALTLKLARDRAYHAAQLDWKWIEIEARSLALQQGEEAAIRYVLKSLGDGHSFYRPPTKQTAKLQSTSFDITSLNLASASSAKVLSEIRQMISGIPVIKIHPWMGNSSQARAATKALRQDLKQLLAAPGCGIILDFSVNSGGNMWPMLVGLSPLLSEGILGYFLDASGTTQTIRKQSGRILIDDADHVLNDAINSVPQHPARFIAIIIGSQSASSGEIVPILFVGQQNVQLFGQRTYGRATANTTFTLPNSGAAVITTAVMLDRHKKRYDTKLEPDYLTTKPVETAAQWILQQCQPPPP